MCRGGLAAAQLGPYARTEAQAALLRAAGGGGPPIDPRQTLDGGLGLPAEDDE